MKKFIYLGGLLLTFCTLVLSGCQGRVEELSETETEASEFDFE